VVKLNQSARERDRHTSRLRRSWKESNDEAHSETLGGEICGRVGTAWAPGGGLADMQGTNEDGTERQRQVSRVLAEGPWHPDGWGIKTQTWVTWLSQRGRGSPLV